MKIRSYQDYLLINCSGCCAYPDSPSPKLEADYKLGSLLGTIQYTLNYVTNNIPYGEPNNVNFSESYILYKSMSVTDTIHWDMPTQIFDSKDDITIQYISGNVYFVNGSLFSKALGYSLNGEVRDKLISKTTINANLNNAYIGIGTGTQITIAYSYEEDGHVTVTTSNNQIEVDSGPSWTQITPTNLVETTSYVAGDSLNVNHRLYYEYPIYGETYERTVSVKMNNPYYTDSASDHIDNFGFTTGYTYNSTTSLGSSSYVAQQISEIPYISGQSNTDQRLIGASKTISRYRVGTPVGYSGFYELKWDEIYADPESWQNYDNWYNNGNPSGEMTGVNANLYNSYSWQINGTGISDYYYTDILVAEGEIRAMNLTASSWKSSSLGQLFTAYGDQIYLD